MINPDNKSFTSIANCAVMDSEQSLCNVSLQNGLNVSPLAPDCSTPNMSDVSDLSSNLSDNNLISRGISKSNPGNFVMHAMLNPNAKSFTPTAAGVVMFSKQKLCNVSLDKHNEESDDSAAKEEEDNLPDCILQNLRIRNINKIIVGHLNINSIRNKFELFADLVKGRVDIILVSETKLNNSFPKPQFNIEGYSALRRDRTENG